MRDSATKKAGKDLVSDTISVITQHIRDNELGPGSQLPSELKLAKQLTVSRSVVREAYRSLSAMHLVKLSAGKRATVAELDYEPMSLMMEHGVLTDQISIQQIYDVRKTIEVRSATLASLRRNEKEALEIHSHAQGMLNNMANPEIVMEHDMALHMTIARASRNPIIEILVGAVQGISEQSWPTGWRSRTDDKQRLEMVEMHMRIADAIVAGDPHEASIRMAYHFDESMKILLDAGLS